MNVNLFMIGMIVYLIILVIIGFVGAGKATDSEHYLVANRGLTLPVLVGTLIAGWLGAGTVVGHANISYSSGFGALWWVGGGTVAITIIILISKKLRRLNLYTVPDLLELRYGPLTKVLGSITIIIAFTGIVGSQIKAMSYVLAAVTDIDPKTGAIIGALLVIFYTVMGGMYSVAYTDVLQYAMLLVGLIIAAPIAFSAAGGFSGWESNLSPTHFEATGGLGLSGALAIALPFLMLATVDQNLYQRMYSAKSTGTARKGAILGLIGGVTVMLLVFVIAVSSAVLFPGINPDLAVYIIATDLLNPFLGMILLIAILSIVMSTADSYLLSPATNVSKDLYQRFIKKDASDKEILIVTRVSVVVLGFIALAGALWFDTFLGFMLLGYTVYGSGVFFPILAAFVWKGATYKGAIASILGGLTSTLIWEFTVNSTIPTIYIGAISSLSLLVIVSLLTEHSSSENVAPFFSKDEDVQEELNEGPEINMEERTIL